MAMAAASARGPTGGDSGGNGANRRMVGATEDDEAVEVRHAVSDDELDDFAVSSDDDNTIAKDAALDGAMMNELLLVCSNLGMLRVQHEGDEAPVLMRGEDCEQWIHDLQRAIRRDHAKHKLVVKQLGKWKILQKKLLPLLVNHQHDWSLVFSILKVLVMLTMKPPRDSTNIAQQLKYLRDYKHAFLREGVVPIIMTILVEPLAKKGSARSAQDYLNMELVLTLVRNLLAIPNEDARFVTSSTSHLSHLQQDLIRTLQEENVYEMLLLFAQDIDSSENREWNLLVMEMLDLTLGCSTPKALAAFLKQPTVSTAASLSSSSTQTAATTATTTTAAPTSAASSSLVHALHSEKKLSQQPRSGARPASHRHSNFGGMMTLVGPTGRTSVLTSFSKLGDEQVPQAAKKPTQRKRGGGRGSSQPPITQTMDVIEIFAPKQSVDESDRVTMAVLVELCDTIIAKSYFQLTNSLKGEFRRGSSKLVSTDRLQYFHLVWFITTYHRLKMQALKSQHRHAVKAVEKQKQALLEALDFETAPPADPVKPELDEKAVLSTLDMFSFNFVLQSIETYATGKNYHGMTVSVKLLAEMMTYLSELSASDDVRFQRIADSLQHKIFYERDFLDRLPVLLKTWTPGLFSMEYVVDVVTLTHIVFKILDAQGTIKVLSRRKAQLEAKRKQQQSKKTKKKNDGDDGDDEGADDNSDPDEEEDEVERRAQLLLEMQRKEADFDVRRYFQSILSFETIKMYCHVLKQYRTNSAKVNHYVHSFFYRAKHFRLQTDQEWTMQPMLYNIHVLTLFHKMLQDTQLAKQHDFRGFLDFIRGVVRDFFTLADKNRLLFVEVLLRQPYAAKTCQLLQRNYEPLDVMAKSRSEAVALGRQEKLDRISEARRQKRALDAEELDGEEEFTFALNTSDFQGSSLAAASKTTEDGDDGEAEFDGQSAVAVSLSAAKTARPKRNASSKAAVERAKNWTKVEDRFLKKVFQQYRHLPSVYEVISYEDMFQDRDRTPEQIERRVKYLKLHRSTHDSSDSEEGDKGAESEEKDQDHGGGEEEEDEDDDELGSRSIGKEWSSEPRLPKGLETDDEDEGGASKSRMRRRRRLVRRGAGEDNDDDGDDSDTNLLFRAPPSTITVTGDRDDAMGDTLVFPDSAPASSTSALLLLPPTASVDAAHGDEEEMDTSTAEDTQPIVDDMDIPTNDRKRRRSVDDDDDVGGSGAAHSPAKISRSNQMELSHHDAATAMAVEMEETQIMSDGEHDEHDAQGQTQVDQEEVEEAEL